MGGLEPMIVMRRWVTLLVIWASLLGLAAPTIACALEKPHCCPGGSPSPCQGSEQPGSAPEAGVACCSVVPESIGTAAIDAVRIRLDIHGGTAPDPVATVGWAHPRSGAAPLRGSRPLSLDSFREDASLTYLRTARLRI